MAKPSNPGRGAAVDAEQQQEQNARLWAEYVRNGDPSVRERLILQYAPLVKYVMGRLALTLPAILDYEDVLSFGTIGLIEAIERFDPDKGVKFETYAIARIKGSILDALRSLDRLPRSVRQKAKVADQAITRLTLDLGRDPTDGEVAESLGLTLEEYLKQLVDSSWVTVSLDTISSQNDSDDERSGGMSIADPDSIDVNRGLERDDMIGELTSSIRGLPEREQLLLSLYYIDELTMREVSKVLGVSESRVCQLHARALSRVRASLERHQQAA